eukprot:TRINITY_DN12158_c0_g2_i1.p1 TRINITY_DN12158_c0_g2~~TRINITY_DN12158_c0_g2_i1.p1  ORF type:complete len:100 (-),score=4.72 TRINITY_DN12158_c0_g2_i1:558-857(-)
MFFARCRKELPGIRSLPCVGKLCGPIAMGPTPDRARQFAANELLISFDLVESNKDQTLCSRVWIQFRLPVWQVSHTGRDVGFLERLNPDKAVTYRDCSI